MDTSESNLMSAVLVFYLEENKANIIKHTDFLYFTLYVKMLTLYL